MDSRKKTDIECPFCEGYFLNIFKELWLSDRYECFMSCGNCGFEMVGRHDYQRRKIKLGNSTKNKYNQLFNKFRKIKGEKNEG